MNLAFVIRGHGTRRRPGALSIGILALPLGRFAELASRNWTDPSLPSSAACQPRGSFDELHPRGADACRLLTAQVIGYSFDRTLVLESRSGAIYRYFAVPQEVLEALVAAESKGAFFNHNVRKRFPHQRLA